VVSSSKFDGFLLHTSVAYPSWVGGPLVKFAATGGLLALITRIRDSTTHFGVRFRLAFCAHERGVPTAFRGNDGPGCRDQRSSERGTPQARHPVTIAQPWRGTGQASAGCTTLNSDWG